MSRPIAASSSVKELLAEWAATSRLGYLAAAYAGSRWLTRGLAGKPSQTPNDWGLTWEPATCLTQDRHRLVGWIITPANAQATVVLCHGVQNHREQTLGRIALLVAAGFRCVAFDHRAHGESSGKRTSFGYYESRDVAAILDYVCERWPHQPRAAIGISMGAAALCYAAGSGPGFHAVVLESLYHDIGTAFQSRLRSYPLWFQRLGHGVIAVTERRLGVRVADLAPIEHIGKLAPAPVFLITGEDDPHATPADTLHLYGRCRTSRDIWFVPKAGHRDVFEQAGREYGERVIGFLRHWLPRAG